MNMRRLARKLRFLTVIALVVVLAGCASELKTAAPDFAPNDREGLVYGRMEVVLNGAVLPPDAKLKHSLVKPEVQATVMPFTTLDEVSTGVNESNGFRLKAPVSSAGDFIVKLPVGRYYVAAFVYWGIATNRTVPVWRTYSAMLGEDLAKPSLVTFDVLPNKATYFGTLQHIIDFNESIPGFGSRIGFGLQVKNEFASTTKRILAPYTALQQSAGIRLVQIQPLTAPIRSSRPLIPRH
jgi:hypothetical protein